MEQFFYLPSSMLWPLAACLVLTGIHVYLGVHVIARKVIFVDLALAQIAALGTVIGILLGYEAGTDTTALYLYSLVFTIFGAFVFSATKMKGERVPHEAIIGIVYAVTFAATMLVISRSALGPQELDHIIKGELLWVRGSTVIKTALIYAAVGIFHFLFRKKFIAISFDQERAEQSGLNVRFWDFLFYMSFGFVITSSVAIAGVFLVFSYLIIPAVGAMLLAERLGARLAIGWIAGSVCSFIGVKLSWDTGLPTSPLVVVVLAAALILAASFRYVVSRKDKVAVLKNIALALGVVAVFIAGILMFRKGEEDPFEHSLHLLESRMATDRVTALTGLELHPSEKGTWLPLVLERLNDKDAEVRRAAVNLLVRIREQGALAAIIPLMNDNSDAVRLSVINAVRMLGESTDGKLLVEAAGGEEDPELQLFLARTALMLGYVDAIPLLAEIVDSGGLFSDEAYDALSSSVPLKFKKNETKRLLQWFQKYGKQLRWDSANKTFTAGGGS